MLTTTDLTNGSVFFSFIHFDSNILLETAGKLLGPSCANTCLSLSQIEQRLGAVG